MSSYAKNIFQDARQTLFASKYDGQKWATTLHQQYVYNHDAYHKMNERAANEHKITTFGEAAKSKQLWKGITAPHLATIKENLEIKLTGLTFKEVKTQIVCINTVKSGQQEEGNDSWGHPTPSTPTTPQEAGAAVEVAVVEGGMEEEAEEMGEKGEDPLHMLVQYTPYNVWCEITMAS